MAHTSNLSSLSSSHSRTPGPRGRGPVSDSRTAQGAAELVPEPLSPINVPRYPDASRLPGRAAHRGVARMTTRRLAAILAADVVGFSTFMGQDEEGTLARINEMICDLEWEP